MNKKDVFEKLMKLNASDKNVKIEIGKAAAMTEKVMEFVGFLDRIKNANISPLRKTGILITLRQLQDSVNRDSSLDGPAKIATVFLAIKRTAEITIPAMEKTYEEEQAKAKKE